MKVLLHLGKSPLSNECCRVRLKYRTGDWPPIRGDPYRKVGMYTRNWTCLAAGSVGRR